MPSPSAASRLALTVLLAAAPLAACGGGEDPQPAGERPVLAEPENPSVADGISDAKTPRILSVVVTDGQRTGDTGVVEVGRNVPVRLTVISDEADTLLVKGYDLRALATAGVPVQLEFIADRAGEFDVVLEDSGVVLMTLRVA